MTVTYLQEGGWVGLLEGLDAELHEPRRLLQLGRALRHLLLERAQSHVPVGLDEVQQRCPPLLQRQHQGPDLGLHLRLQLRAVFLGEGNYKKMNVSYQEN